jgi:hypothetical protein
MRSCVRPSQKEEGQLITGPRLLISGSKVRVLDGPPITTGASRTPEAPADFPSAVQVRRPSKAAVSCDARVKECGSIVFPEVMPTPRRILMLERLLATRRSSPMNRGTGRRNIINSEHACQSSSRSFRHAGALWPAPSVHLPRPRLALSRPRRRRDVDRSRGDTLFTVRAVRLQLYRVSTRLVPRA